MASWFSKTVERIRLAVLPFASLAILLPMPAKCVAYSPESPRNGAGCCETKAKAAAADRSCCLRHGAQHEAPAPCGPSCWQPDSDCGCCSQPSQRTIPPNERIAHFNNSFAADSGAVLNDVQDDLQLLVCRALADLPSPIPHRILHCSWQI